MTVSSPYFLRASLLTSSLVTMQSSIFRALSLRTISSSLSFARGREIAVESRKLTSPKVRAFVFTLPMSARCSVTKSLRSCSSLATLSL